MRSGTCGENLTWTLDYSGTLTINGRGAMKNYSFDNEAPWYYERSSIKKVVINTGVTSIGDSAFNFCLSLKEITIPEGVTSIGKRAFWGCERLKKIYYPVGADFAKKLRAGNDAELIPY